MGKSCCKKQTPWNLEKFPLLVSLLNKEGNRQVSSPTQRQEELKNKINSIYLLFLDWMGVILFLKLLLSQRTELWQSLWWTLTKYCDDTQVETYCCPKQAINLFTISVKEYPAIHKKSGNILLLFLAFYVCEQGVLYNKYLGQD